MIFIVIWNILHKFANDDSLHTMMVKSILQNTFSRFFAPILISINAYLHGLYLLF